MWLTLFLILTIQGCASKPAAELILPPEPQREELAEAHSVSDMAERINYYEHLVQLWEQWAKDVKAIIGKNSSNAEIIFMEETQK